MPIATTVPQLAVGVAKVTTPPLLMVCGVVPVLTADQPLEVVILARAYEPPDTSVPPVPSSAGAVVKSATYTVVGAVPNAVPFIQFNNLSSRYVDLPAIIDNSLSHPLQG